MKVIFTALALVSAASVRAATLYDADLALQSGDPTQALKITESLAEVFPKNSEEGGQCLLKKSEALLALGRTDSAEETLRSVSGIPGMPPEIVSEAALRRIRLLKTTRPRDAREMAKSWLRDHPAASDAAGARLLLSDLFRAEGDLKAALEVLSSRPAETRKTPGDAPLAEAEKRLRLALKAREKSAEYKAPDTDAKFEKALRAAEALRKESPRKAADAYGRIVTSSEPSPGLRLRAALERVECLDEAGEPRAALAAAAFLAEFDDPAPPERIAEGRLAAASLALDVGEDAARALALARDALVVLPPASEPADAARWLIARALVRQKAPPDDVWESLADSPVVKNNPRPRTDPRHPVNRLLAAGGSLADWIESDLHRRPPSGGSALLRAADECFAATRYAEAARLYAKAETFGSPGPDIRSFAALQRARAMALSPAFREALPLWRRFVTDKSLAKSAYAPEAVIRAGAYCEGRLRDAKQAREFFRIGYESHSGTDPGQGCLIYHAESLADGGDRAGAIALYRRYLAEHPAGFHAQTARNFLADLQPAKK